MMKIDQRTVQAIPFPSQLSLALQTRLAAELLKSPTSLDDRGPAA
jgi:hypothetical protein